MADITSLCTIKGANQHAERPFQWHVWDISIPSGTLTEAQVDDVRMPERYRPGLAIMGVRTVVVTAGASSTSTILGVFETAVETIATGAIGSEDTLISSIDLESLGLRAATFSTLDAVGSSLFNITEATQRGLFNLQITPAATLTDGDIRLLVGVLMGRVEY